MSTAQPPQRKRTLLISGAILAALLVRMAPAAYGAWTATTTVPIPAISAAVLGTPQLSPCQEIGGSVRVAWAATEGAEKYEVYVQTSGGTPKLLRTVQATETLSVDVSNTLLGGLGLTLSAILGGRTDILVVARVGSNWESTPARQRITANALIPGVLGAIRCVN